MSDRRAILMFPFLNWKMLYLSIYTNTLKTLENENISDF